jgi:hypothetical protein
MLSYHHCLPENTTATSQLLPEPAHMAQQFICYMSPWPSKGAEQPCLLQWSPMLCSPEHDTPVLLPSPDPSWNILYLDQIRLPASMYTWKKNITPVCDVYICQHGSESLNPMDHFCIRPRLDNRLGVADSAQCHPRALSTFVFYAKNYPKID